MRAETTGVVTVPFAVGGSPPRRLLCRGLTPPFVGRVFRSGWLLKTPGWPAGLVTVLVDPTADQPLPRGRGGRPGPPPAAAARSAPPRRGGGRARRRHCGAHRHRGWPTCAAARRRARRGAGERLALRQGRSAVAARSVPSGGQSRGDGGRAPAPGRSLSCRLGHRRPIIGRGRAGRAARARGRDRALPALQLHPAARDGDEGATRRTCEDEGLRRRGVHAGTTPS